MLAFVGEANDGRDGVVCALRATGIRLGVLGAEAVGESLRRLAGEGAIDVLDGDHECMIIAEAPCARYEVSTRGDAVTSVYVMT